MKEVDTLKAITDFAAAVLHLREVLQDGRTLKPDESRLLENALEALQHDLEMSRKRAPKKQSTPS